MGLILWNLCLGVAVLGVAMGASSVLDGMRYLWLSREQEGSLLAIILLSMLYLLLVFVAVYGLWQIFGVWGG